MNNAETREALNAAISAAQSAGNVMRGHLNATKRINEATQHDIKLELDVHCQKLIERMLHKAFPDIPLLGEEGDSGDVNDPIRWVVDPIDGTVNFTYGIPHACVCIALQVQSPGRKVRSPMSKVQSRKECGSPPTSHETILGVIYDPFADELWTAIKGQRAKLNGKPIRVSKRNRLDDCVVSIGFAKSKATLDNTLPYFNRMVQKIRKVRIMGSAGLALTYVASGRFDAYVETGVSLWDIAAGGLIVECAGGEFWSELNPDGRSFRMVASNGLLRRKLQAL